MNKYLLVGFFIIATIFSGCAPKNNVPIILNLNESQKKFEEVAIYGISQNTALKYHQAHNTRELCIEQTNINFKELTNIPKFAELLAQKNIKVTNITNSTKRLLVIRPTFYEGSVTPDWSSFGAFKCSISRMEITVYLYEVEELSKAWTFTNQNNKPDFNNFEVFGDKHLLYKNIYYLDGKYNVYPTSSPDYLGLTYRLSLDDNTKDIVDIRKFFNKIIEDLEKVLEFPVTTKTLEVDVKNKI